MNKQYRPGRLVVVLQGRFAGKKAVIIKANQQGTKERKYGHALVVGVENPPRKVTKKMNNNQIKKKTTMKAFIKYINLNHFMPTRYNLPEPDTKEIKQKVDENDLTNVDKKLEMKKKIRKLLADKYRRINKKNQNNKEGQANFLFKKLKF